MRCMIGLKEPRQGTVRYGADSYWDADPPGQERIRRKFGVLYQQGALWSSMTLAENIALPLGEYTDLSPHQIREVASLKLALVGPIRFPPYLDRSGIVTRTNSNAIEIAEFDVWAGTLSSEFPRVLADNLSALLATDRVSTFPRLMGHPVDYQVTGDVVQFDGSPNGQVTLVARWNLVRARERKHLASRQSTISLSVGAPSYEALVAAQSRAVEELAREIAAALKSLPR